MAKPGDVLELAVWMDGSETPEMIEQFKAEIGAAFALAAEKRRLTLGPPVWAVKRPGDERVPPVPKWLESRYAHRVTTVELGQGLVETVSSPALLVCERVVTGSAPAFVAPGFSADLGAADLAKLRAITKRAYIANNPTHTPLNDGEADYFIDQMGPDVAYRMIRNAEALN